MATGICGCHRSLQAMWCIFILFYFAARWGGGKRKNVINLLGGENSITSSYSAMQSVVQGDVTGRQAESQGCLHFKPNFQFSPPIFLHSHWSWKLRRAHLCGEGGRGIKGKLHFTTLTSYLFNVHYLYVGVQTSRLCFLCSTWYIIPLSMQRQEVGLKNGVRWWCT